MTQLPFDPDAALGPPPPETGPDHLTVSEVASLIKSTLEGHTPSTLRVIGEISNLSCQNHWFFSLKDEGAVLSCVAWASAARSFGFVPQDGAEVVATGSLSHYPPQGRTQLYVRQLTPVGAGALELRFRALCEELRGLGYFDEARKKPLPVLPRRIAVVTSGTSAALQDVIATAAQRCRAVALLLVDVRVQGDGAAEQVAAAIRRLDARGPELGLDAILVTRGGGSIEDLWAFNERVVADAAFACRVPLVAAIGHESDTTVIELVADVRAATPTQAVMRLIPAADQLARQVDHLGDRLLFVMRRLLERQRQRLEMLASYPLFRDPGAASRLAGERLGALEERLRRGIRVALGRWTDRADSLGRQLDGIDPQGVLSRGYSYTTTADGRLVRRVGDVRRGQSLFSRVSDGTIESVVAQSPAGEQMELFAEEGTKARRHRGTK